MSRPYRQQKGAQPFNGEGQLLCDRCGRVVHPWLLLRPDNCGLGNGAHCIRNDVDVIASWKRYGFLREVEQL